MPPKPKKSPTRSKSPKKNANEKDDGAFFVSPLNEENWNAMVAFLAPSSAYEELLLEQIDKSVKTGQRRRFTWLSKKELIEFISENIGKKAAAGKQKSSGAGAIHVPVPSPLLSLLETTKPYIDNKEDIPDQLLAQILKGKLLHIRAIEKEKEAFRASLASKKTSSRASAKGGKKEKSPSGKKSPPKNKKAGGPMPDIEKTTVLKKKEELDEEEKFIDDEPIDGPSHYIIISGIYSTKFFNHVDEFGIPIDCLIKFKAQSDDTLRSFLGEIDEREKLETNLKANLKLSADPAKNANQPPPNPIDVIALSEERQAYYKKMRDDLEKFWNEINQVLEKSTDDKLLQHIARIKFILKESPKLKSWFEIEARSLFSDKMFTELAEKLYSLVIRKRHYGFYVNNLKLYAIPAPNPTFNYQQPPPFALPGQTTKETGVQSSMAPDFDKVYDTRYYNELLNSVPSEYVSTPIILYSMVEQIVANEERKPLPSEKHVPEKKMPQINNLTQEVAFHFSHMIDNLALDEQDKQKLASLLPQRVENPEHVKKNADLSPFLVNHNDEIGLRLKGVFEDINQKRTKKVQKLPFDPLDVETEMLSKSLFTVFTGLPEVPQKLAKERAARLQELLHFCTTPEITNADVDRTFKQFVFETMNLTEVTKKNFVQRNDNQNYVIPWDDPYPNIQATLSEEKQIVLKSLNILDAKKEFDEKQQKNSRISSASSVKSIKFQDAEVESNAPSSILKSRPSTKLSVQSVHFPDTYDSDEQAIEIVRPKTVDQVVDMINSTKKRDLTDWNFAEHYDSKSLVQVLQNINYTHPYVDSYYNRRDDSLMLVFSNPHDETCLSNHEEWTIKVHSNVGFRNYLEKIYEMIDDWTRDEEAKYQANLVAKEVDPLKSESSESFKKDESRPSSKSSKKGKSKSRSPTPNKKKEGSPAGEKKKKGDKDGSRSQTGNPEKLKIKSVQHGSIQEEEIENESSSPGPNEDNDHYITDQFVGHQSLKNWKIEHDKQVAAEEVKNRKNVKSPKGGKGSPSGKKDQAGKGGKESKADKAERAKSSSSQSPSAKGGNATPKQKGSRENSPKGKRSRSNSKTQGEPEKVESPKAQTSNQPTKEPFIGYDVGNNMIYVKSYLTHMFPTNGALIKTERHTLKTTGSTFLTSSLIKDDHTFSIHLVDPKTESSDLKLTSEEANTSISNLEMKTVEEDKSIAKYVGFTGVFKDGLSLSISNQNLVSKHAKPQTPALNQLESVSFTTTQQFNSDEKDGKKEEKKEEKGSKKGGDKGKKGKKDQPVEITKQQEIKAAEQHLLLPNEIKEEPKFKILPWTQLYLSVPTGLSCSFLPESYTGVTPTADNEPHKLVVKQSYVTKCTEKASEHLKNFNPNVLKEKSRLIKSDGTVIKFLNDNSIDVYYPNGTIYRKRVEVTIETDPSHDNNQQIVESEQVLKDKAKMKKNTKSMEEQTSHVNYISKTKWIVVTPSGNEYLVNKEEQKYELIKVYRSIKEYDDRSDETMVTREDNLKMIFRPDGSNLIEFDDGTRITRFYDDPAKRAALFSSSDFKIIVSSEFKSSGASTDDFKTLFTKVECPGFATTIFNSKSAECNLLFGNGTFVTCDPIKSTYSLNCSSGEELNVTQSGLISFCSKNTNPGSNNKFNFSLNSEVVFEHEDETRNVFKVNKTGKNVIHSATPYRQKSLIRNYKNHSPRFFIIHKDSSGTELLRFEDVREYLNEAELDPMTAIIRDNVQGYPNIIGTTVLRPIKNCMTDLWLSEYDEKDITPHGLRCRNLLSFPHNPEIKVAGPRFGTNIGRSLNIDLNQARRVKNPPLVISKRMEYRQFIEYQKLSQETRAQLITSLKNYMNYIAERAEVHRKFLTHDPRTDIEKFTAFKVLKIARPDHLLNSDISKLYRDSVNQNKILLTDKNINQYKKLMTNVNNSKTVKLQLELHKARENREAWKKSFVPPYFQSEWGKVFFDSKNNGLEHNDNNANSKNNAQGDFLQTSEHDFAAIQPLNNSNARANAKNNDTDRSDSKMSKKYSSLPPISQPDTDASSQKKGDIFPFDRYQPQFKHEVKLDDKRLPNSIKFNRPNAGPNDLYLSVEEPVRRKVNNSIVNTSKLNQKSLERRRGLEVYPNRLNFGTLRESFTYITDFEMVNVGIDACRFKIKQPPSETGIKIIFKPGPLAAGMSRDFTVMILAMYSETNKSENQKSQSERIRNLLHELEITTETDVFKLPIEAKIATAEEFRTLYRGNLEAGKEKYVKILSVRPGNTKEVLTKPFNTQNSVNDANFEFKSFSIKKSESGESLDNKFE